MDDVESLEELSNILSELAEKPYDLTLHQQHIALAQKYGMDDQLQVAREMLTSTWAMTDDFWLPTIESLKATVNLNKVEGIQSVLDMFTRAEEDYLSIPLLCEHAQFISDTYNRLVENGNLPEPSATFSPQWTILALKEVALKSSPNIRQSHLVWAVLYEWLSEVIDTLPVNHKGNVIPLVDELLLEHLQQPHSNNDETLQTYSSFTTNHKSPAEYESLLVAASKTRSRAVKAYDRREKSETMLAQSNNSIKGYQQYIGYERRAREVDIYILSGTFERAISETATRRSKNEAGAAEALSALWVAYLDDVRRNYVELETQATLYKRALRSVPASGEVWARYLRFLEHQETTEDAGSTQEPIADAYTRALGTQLLYDKPEDLVSLALARVGYERRQIDKNENVEDTFLVLVQTLEHAIGLVRQVAPGDPRLRLERYLADIYENLASATESSLGVLQAAAQHHKSSYFAWQVYTDALIKAGQYAEAREVYQDISEKNLDWPEGIWDAWLSFENLHGSLNDLETCTDKVERTQAQVNFRRAKDAQKAAYQAARSAPAHDVPMASAAPANEPQLGGEVASVADSVTGVAMDVDSTEPSHALGKRKTEDLGSNTSKKAKTEPATVLKRDRENCTVFVDNLPKSTEETDLRSLFKDCGAIRELKLTHLPNAIVAAVEFTDRESVPGALTKDKKRVQNSEVGVHLAWQSTLYVTNFPEGTDDARIRELFGAYGTIFDVRWPSKKFKSTRRFCYIQYTSPAAAKASLELHGRELEPTLPLTVYISNPERKKERTDADAADKEIYVAGLSKFTKEGDLQRLFKTYGAVKQVRMETDKDNNCRGFAFIEFDDEASATRSLDANNHELKGRRIAVTIADARRSRKKPNVPTTGLGLQADTRSRTVRLENIPENVQEGLLQQFIEKQFKVRRLEIFHDRHEAEVEFDSAADAGQALLGTEWLNYEGQQLTAHEMGDAKTKARAGAKPGAAQVDRPTQPANFFVPRVAAGRPKAGLGKARTNVSSSSNQAAAAVKGQDDFRKLLG